VEGDLWSTASHGFAGAFTMARELHVIEVK
jgi:hypothetical protein